MVMLLSVKWCSDRVNIPGVHRKDYNSEIAFQIYCADWLRKQFQITGNEGFSYWHHSANEGGGMKRGFTVKMMGQSKGYPDLVQHSLKLAIELKLISGVVSPEQTKWLNHFRSIGYRSEVVYNFERFRDIVLQAIEDKDNSL